MASKGSRKLVGDAETVKIPRESIWEFSSCCTYTATGVVCSANPMAEQPLGPEEAEYGMSFSCDQVTGRRGDAEPVGDGSDDDKMQADGFSGRDDNPLVQTHRLVGEPFQGDHRYFVPSHAERVEYSDHQTYSGQSSVKRGTGRASDYASNKGRGRGRNRGRGRTNPTDTNWTASKPVIGPISTEISGNNAGHDADACGYAVALEFSCGSASEPICSGKSGRASVGEHGVEGLFPGDECKGRERLEDFGPFMKKGSEEGFSVATRRNPGNSHSVTAGSRKRGSDWNAMSNGGGQWRLPQNMAGRGRGIDQSERHDHVRDGSDGDQTRCEVGALPPAIDRYVPGRDHYEPVGRGQSIERSNSPTGRNMGETWPLHAQAKGKGAEGKTLGNEGDQHGFTRNKGRGRGRNMGERQRDTSQRGPDPISSLGRLLTTILRHKANLLGLNIRSDGYVPVQDLLKLKMTTLAGVPLCACSIDDVKEAVRNDNKQRLGLVDENGEPLIRANQGHSIQAVESEKLLRPISSAEKISVCVHGTYRKYLDSILASGLNCMGRRHIHFATGLPKDSGVISGMRGDCEILIYLDVEKVLNDGMKIYLSENGVVLTEGFEGIVPPKYFAKIETWPRREVIHCKWN